jgi:hypothetical protein
VAKPSVKERGPKLLEALIGHLAGPDSPVGDPQPLDAAALRAFEDAIGVAVSPAMAALLGFDRGFAARELGWFRDGVPLATPVADRIAERLGPFFEVYDAALGRRLPGRALPLEESSEATRFLYLGDPDAHGEYPVLFVDTDDIAVLGVEDAGFDLWIARRLGILGARAFADDVKATGKRLFGRQTPLSFDALPKKLPPPVDGPPPGTVTHVSIAPPEAKKARKLTDAQVQKALVEHATSGNTRRLEELVTDAKSRGLPAKVIDDALVAAAFQGPLAAVEALLAAGANPRARDYYGCALARAAHNDDDRVHHALLAAGADPNGPSVNGQTALHQVVEAGKLDLVRAYLARGANAAKADAQKRTPLHVALDTAHSLEMFDLLLPHADLKKGPALLVQAVERVPLESVRRLIEAGADPNLRSDFNGRTALHAAFELGRDELAPMLVAGGAQRSLRDERGISLEQVYGEAGEDVRPIDVAYVPSVAPQTMTLRVQVAILNHLQFAMLAPAWIDPGHWSGLARRGAMGGGRLDAKRFVLELGPPGYARGDMDLEVEGLSPAFVRWMVATMIHQPGGIATTSGHLVVRVVGLEARGSVVGETSVTGESVRALTDAPSRAFDASPASELVVRGDAPGITATFERPPSGGDIAAFTSFCRAWWETHPLWGRPTPGDGWTLSFQPPTVDGAKVTVPLFGKTGTPWSYASVAPEALFSQMAPSFPAPAVLTLPR